MTAQTRMSASTRQQKLNNKEPGHSVPDETHTEPQVTSAQQDTKRGRSVSVGDASRQSSVSGIGLKVGCNRSEAQWLDGLGARRDTCPHQPSPSALSQLASPKSLKVYPIRQSASTRQQETKPHRTKHDRNTTEPERGAAHTAYRT